MSSDLVTLVLAFGVTATSVVMAGYAAYLALAVWRGLAVPIYRSRALWTAVLAIGLGAFGIFYSTVNLIFPPEYQSAPAFIIGGIVAYAVAEVALYVWIDRTIGTLIRLDFLRRDLLGWKRFRPIYWGLALVSIVLSALPPPSPPYSLLSVIAITVSLLVPFSYGAIALVVGSRKTRDSTFRSHARWGGYCLLAIVIYAVTYSFSTNVVIQNLPPVLVSYCLYKMAKFLVPVGSFQAT